LIRKTMKKFWDTLFIICAILILLSILITIFFWIEIPPRAGTEYHPAAYPNSTWVCEDPYLCVNVDSLRHISGIMRVDGKDINVDLRFTVDSVRIEDSSTGTIMIFGLIEASDAGVVRVNIKHKSRYYGDQKTDIFDGKYKEITLVMQDDNYRK